MSKRKSKSTPQPISSPAVLPAGITIDTHLKEPCIVQIEKTPYFDFPKSIKPRAIIILACALALDLKILTYTALAFIFLFSICESFQTTETKMKYSDLKKIENGNALHKKWKVAAIFFALFQNHDFQKIDFSLQMDCYEKLLKAYLSKERQVECHTKDELRGALNTIFDEFKKNKRHHQKEEKSLPTLEKKLNAFCKTVLKDEPISGLVVAPR